MAPKPKTRGEERRPMHLRLSQEERGQLNRVAAQLGLSPSATVRFLVNAANQRGTDTNIDTLMLTYAGVFPDD